MKAIGFHFKRFGIYLYVQNLYKYSQLYITPGFTIEAVKGIDKHFDIELKFLFWALGIRLIFLNSKK